MADLSTMLNAIWTTASAEYQTRIPTATATNLSTVGTAIMNYEPAQNEFLSALVNRIGLTIVTNKIANNPLRILKKGGVPLGTDVQNIYTNMSKANTFDAEGSTLLSRNIPDVKAVYHRLNRKDQYTATVTIEMLQQAFTSMEKMNELITSIVNSLYSGDNYDEFILMKKLFTDAVAGTNQIIKLDITEPTDQATNKTFVKALKTVSKEMTFPSSAFNQYANNARTGDTKPVITWTPQEDQILILRADISANIDVDVLATAFNMAKADVGTMTLDIDNFGNSDCLAILADKAWVQVYDNMQKMSEFYNSKGLYWNYFWNHWQTYGICHFANAVAFMKKSV